MSSKNRQKYYRNGTEESIKEIFAEILHHHFYHDKHLIMCAFFVFEEYIFIEAQDEADKMEYKDLQIMGINSDKGFKVTPKELEDSGTQFDEDFFKDLMSVFKKILILLYYGEKIVNSPEFEGYSHEFFTWRTILRHILCQINEDFFPKVEFHYIMTIRTEREKHCRNKIRQNYDLQEGIGVASIEETMFESIVYLIISILPIEVCKRQTREEFLPIE